MTSRSDSPDKKCGLPRNILAEEWSAERSKPEAFRSIDRCASGLWRFEKREEDKLASRMLMDKLHSAVNMY